MTCAQCGHEPPEGSTFCNGCGAKLAVTCPSCGATPPPESRFCNECGGAIGGPQKPEGSPSRPAREPASATPQSDARKVVTIVFADLAGSTALHERLDPESVLSFMESYYRAMRAAIEAHGGTLVKLLGDGVMAAFGVPHVAEDDAIRAVHAGIEMQQAFRQLAAEHADIDLRIAINTGEVVVSADNADVLGDPVNVAARLQQEAQAGDVVIGETTRRLVATHVTLQPLGSFALRGRAEQVKAYRVVSLERPTGAAAAAFVGRGKEMGRITAIFDAAVSQPAARLAVLLGSPGLGKSRLIGEVTQSLGDNATAVVAQCDAAGGKTFAPVAGAIRELLGAELVGTGDSADAAAALHGAIEAAIPMSDAERSRIAAGIAALLAGSPASPEETFFVIRRFLTGLAQTRPVVLVIDDLHWAEPLLLDLVEHLVQWGSGVPLLVLVGARPELRELRSSLVTRGGLVSDVITLGGLDAGAAMRLAASVIGASDLPAAVAAKVLSTTEGNPLFVGELVRMLVDEGAIERQGDRWIIGANLAALEMPPTIHALLAARIERLRPEERTVLEHASVVGRHFSRSAVSALLGRNGSELDARLEGLRRTELIEPDTGWFLGEPVMRFHHVLIRDAAYRRLLKGKRAELHAQLAEWIEAKVGDAPEHDETIGRHLEQAHQLLSELGAIDAKGRALGARAAARLAAAGRRALGGDDVPLAANLLGRAIARLDTGDTARAELALDWCEALLSAGDVGQAKTAIAELSRFTTLPTTDPAISQEAKSTRRLSAWQTCFAGQLTVLTAPQGLQDAASSVSAAALELAALGDSAGEAKAHFVHALALSRLGEVGSCEAALDRALAAARGAGDRRRANTVLAIAPVAALWGPSPVTRASGRCLDVVRVLRITQGAPAVEAVALSCQGVLEALRGRTEAARRMIASAHKMVEELGITQRVLEADVSAGLVELLEGDAPAAERYLRGAYEGLRDLGLGIAAAQASALLARALLAQGRDAEAEALSHESELLAGDDLKAAIAWRGVRAEALARRGEHAAAVELANKAVELAAATDALLDHADARLALAAALRAAGRRAESDAEERRARDLWETKGATLLAERAQRAAASAVPTAARPAAAAQPPASLRRATVANPVRYGRRLPHNFALEGARRIEAAVASRDLEAAIKAHRHDIEVVEHQHGVSYGYDGIQERIRMHIQDSAGSAFQHEPLATLGDSLALFRLSSTATASTLHGASIGATEVPYVIVSDADEQGCARRIDMVGEDKLGEAIACLYERYATKLPEGAAAERASATARTATTFLAAAPDLDASCARCAPAIELIDHRAIGFEPVRGIAAMREYLRALFEVEDFTIRVDDVLRLSADAFLVRQTTHGTARVGGGAYDRHLLTLCAFSGDGLLSLIEEFDIAREAEALARFDEITADSRPRAVRRRVLPNAATVASDRIAVAIEQRDASAIAELCHPSFVEIDHPTGSTYGRAEAIASTVRFMRSSDVSYRIEPLATLGHLMLGRRRIHASGAHGQRFDVGEYENETILMAEVDERGLVVRHEVFARDRLGEAITRLFEVYAERQPEGLERSRALTIARNFIWGGPIDLERTEAGNAPSSPIVDHRVFRTWDARNREEQMQHWRHQMELVSGFSARVEDLLGLELDAALIRTTYFGTSRESGGAFENPLCVVMAFGADGLITNNEIFEAEQEAEALARFDEIIRTKPRRRRVRANAATLGGQRLAAAMAARDAGALEDLFDAGLQVVHHPTAITYGRREMLKTWRSAIRAERVEFRPEPLATLGDRLALTHQVTTVEGLAEAHLKGFGVTEVAEISLLEADERGRFLHVELFAPEHLGDAIVRLYERNAALLPDGPERDRATVTARVVAFMLTSAQAPDLSELYAPTLQDVDHRNVGHGTLSRDEAGRLLPALHEVAENLHYCVDDVLALASNGLVRKTTSTGVWREGGGTFERTVCALSIFGADGRVTRHETFEGDRDAEALARFDELVGEGEVGLPADPFMNAASATSSRVAACLVAHDWHGFAGLFADKFHMSDRRRVVQLELDRDAYVAFTREVADGRRVRNSETKLLATRGERLSLTRSCFVFEDANVGPSEISFLLLEEVDERGRLIAYVRWDLEDVDAAYVELDRRFAAGEGALVGGVTSRFLERFARRDWDAIASMCAPTLVEHDHRRITGLGTTRGATGWVQKNLRTWVEVDPETTFGFAHLRVCPRGYLSDMSIEGSSQDGGHYEVPILVVGVLDTLGRYERFDLYDPDQVDQAFARFDLLKLGTRAEATEPFHNMASRADLRLVDCFNSRDWTSIEALAAPELVFDERRRLSRNTCGREVWLQQFRVMFDVPASRFGTALRATRGESLALSLHQFDGEVAGGGGPLEIEDHFTLHEVDGDGRIVAIVLFDLEDLDAAYEELDRRFDAGEGAPFRGINSRFVEGVARRDWRAIAELAAPAMVEHDHRPITGVGATHGVEAWVQKSLRSWVDVAEDTVSRCIHERCSGRGVLCQYTWEGAPEGSGYEVPVLTVSELDENGLIQRIDVYALEQMDRAFARFEELKAPRAADRFANAATRFNDRLTRAWAARDWDTVAAIHERNTNIDDRRRIIRLQGGHDLHLAFLRDYFEKPNSRWIITAIATRGEFLALSSVRLAGQVDAEGGDFIIDFLAIDEVAINGDSLAVILFDADDLDAAYAELTARYEAGEAAAFGGLFSWYERAYASRDWDSIAKLYSPDFIEQDHRKVAVLGTMRGDRGWESDRALVELAPDTILRIDHIRHCERGFLSRSTWHGTHVGARYEISMVIVYESDEQGRGVRNDLYDPEQLGEAFARLEELRARPAAPRDALLTFGKPNAAAAAMERWQASFDAAVATGDWSAMRAVCAPGMIFDDRRRLALISGDRELMIASARERVAIGARPDLRLVGAAGERVIMQNLLWAGGPPDGRFEIEYFGVMEADEAGLLTAIVLFDIDDRDAAQREAWKRWAAIEPAVVPLTTALADSIDFWNTKDSERVRASFAEDLVVEDRRRTGTGRIEGRDAYVQSVLALWRLAPDSRLEAGQFWLAVAPHGGVFTSRRFGMLPGGGEFESVFLTVSLTENGRTKRLEFFELDAGDAALARFEELSAREAARCSALPALMKPNLATASLERAWAGVDALDLAVAEQRIEAAHTHFAPGFVWEDRRPIVGLSGGADLMVASIRERLASGQRPERRTIIGTAGDRIAIARVLWAGGPPEGRFEVEFLAVEEVNQSGLATAAIFFEPDDWRDAQREAWKRWATIDPSVVPVTTAVGRVIDAWNAKDRELLLAALAGNLVVEDRRLAGIGHLEGAEAYAESVSALWSLAPESRLEAGSFWLAATANGGVFYTRRIGIVPGGGGEYESDYFVLMLVDGGRISHFEFYETDDVEAALARFDEIVADTTPAASKPPLRIPPNAAMRAWDRWEEATATGKVDPAFYHPDYRLEDRRRLVRLTHGVDGAIGSDHFLVEGGWTARRKALATAGDRLFLQHIVWTTGEKDGISEIEVLQLEELGRDGRWIFGAAFDPDARAAAQHELLERWVASGAEGELFVADTTPAGAASKAPSENAATRCLDRFAQATARRDWAGLSDRFGAQLQFDDRRPLLRLRLSLEGFLEQHRTLFEVPNGKWIVTTIATRGERLALSRLLFQGDVDGGGGTLEIDHLAVLGVADDGRFDLVVLFEPADLDAAYVELDRRFAG